MEEQTKQEAPKVESKPPKNPEPPVSGPLAPFEAWLYDMLVHKAPFHLPLKAKDWIVQYGPWIALVGGILAALFVIPAAFTALSITGYTSAVLGAYGYTASVAAFTPVLYLSLAVFALQLIIMFVSIPMLLKRQRKGWLLLFYSDVISVVYSLVSSFTYGFNFGTLLGGIVGAVIGFYLIFQIRSYYKK